MANSDQKFLSLAGLAHYDGRIKAVSVGGATIEGRTITLKSVSGAVLATVTVPETVYTKATALVDGLMSKEDFAKLEGVAEGATKVEENATNGKLTINGQTIDVYIHPTQTALAAGLYKISTDGTGHVTTGTAVLKSDITALGIPAQDTTYEDATQKASGLMSAADKTKLDGVSEGATKTEASGTNGKIKIDGTEVNIYTHEKFTAKASGLYKMTVNDEGHVSATTPVGKTDITALGIPAQDTTYEKATAETDGLESKEHFAKVEGIEAGAQVNVIEKISVNGSALPINSKNVNLDLSGYALKADITTVMRYCGSVATYADLPKSAVVGDVYNVQAAFDDDEGHHAAGTNVAKSATGWDALAVSFTYEFASNAEIDAEFDKVLSA